MNDDLTGLSLLWLTTALNLIVQEIRRRRLT